MLAPIRSARAFPGWRPRHGPRSQVAVAALVFLFAFGLYGSTAGPSLAGYEPETAAVAEGFVRTGDFQILSDSPLRSGGTRGRDGKLFGRAGLPQSLFESPFYLAGWALDGTHGDQYRYRKALVRFYNPLVAALAAAAVFILVLRLRGSKRWAVELAVLFTAATLSWPYAKIGMETTLMLALVLTAAGAAGARADGKLLPWTVAGFGAGMALASKPYALPAAAALFVMLPFGSVSRERRMRLFAAVLGPLIAWAMASAWFNWDRTGSILNAGQAPFRATLAAPLNFAGYFASPGKGLLLYSPLVLLGALGLPALWREQRRTATAIVATLGLLSAVVALTPYWTDETWGPRYIVAAAWLPLIAIPWWATTRRRRHVLAAVTAIAVLVQVVAVVVPYRMIVTAAPRLTGYAIYQPASTGPLAVPFGQDPTRWIPQLSPLVIQGALVVSRLGEQFGAPPITYRYEPFAGRKGALRLDRKFATEAGFARPDFWWLASDTGAGRGLVVVLIIAAIAAAGALRAELRLDRHDRRVGMSQASADLPD